MTNIKIDKDIVKNLMYQMFSNLDKEKIKILNLESLKFENVWSPSNGDYYKAIQVNYDIDFKSDHPITNIILKDGWMTIGYSTYRNELIKKRKEKINRIVKND